MNSEDSKKSRTLLGYFLVAPTTSQNKSLRLPPVLDYKSVLVSDDDNEEPHSVPASATRSVEQTFPISEEYDIIEIKYERRNSELQFRSSSPDLLTPKLELNGGREETADSMEKISVPGFPVANQSGKFDVDVCYSKENAATLSHQDELLFRDSQAVDDLELRTYNPSEYQSLIRVHVDIGRIAPSSDVQKISIYEALLKIVKENPDFPMQEVLRQLLDCRKKALRRKDRRENIWSQRSFHSQFTTQEGSSGELDSIPRTLAKKRKTNRYGMPASMATFLARGTAGLSYVPKRLNSESFPSEPTPDHICRGKRSRSSGSKALVDLSDESLASGDVWFKGRSRQSKSSFPEHVSSPYLTRFLSRGSNSAQFNTSCQQQELPLDVVPLRRSLRSAADRKLHIDMNSARSAEGHTDTERVSLSGGCLPPWNCSSVNKQPPGDTVCKLVASEKRSSLSPRRKRASVPRSLKGNQSTPQPSDIAVSFPQVSTMTENEECKTLLWVDLYQNLYPTMLVVNREAMLKIESVLNQFFDAGCQTTITRLDEHSMSSDEDFSGTQSDRYVSNTLVLSGPVGCGKTSAVYHIADKLGMQVLEMGSAVNRSGKDLDTRLSEAVHTQTFRGIGSGLVSRRQRPEAGISQDFQSSLDVTDYGNSPTVGCGTLILLDEADVTFELQDKGFWTTLNQLRLESRRMFIITVNDESVLRNLEGSFQTVRLQPATIATVPHLQLVCALEGILIGADKLRSALHWAGYDLRRLLNQLQLYHSPCCEVLTNFHLPETMSSSAFVEFLREDSGLKRLELVEVAREVMFLREFETRSQLQLIAANSFQGSCGCLIKEENNCSTGHPSREIISKLKAMSRSLDMRSLFGQSCGHGGIHPGYSPTSKFWRASVSHAEASTRTLFSAEVLQPRGHYMDDVQAVLGRDLLEHAACACVEETSIDVGPAWPSLKQACHLVSHTYWLDYEPYLKMIYKADAFKREISTKRRRFLPYMELRGLYISDAVQKDMVSSDI